MVSDLFKRAHKDFAFLRETSNIYMDSASTSLKPDVVLDAIAHYYQHGASNVGRSNHRHAQLSTQWFEHVRSQVGHFIHCASDEVIFTANCTDAINLVAASLDLAAEDHVIVSPLEHHSNLLPWMYKCRTTLMRLMPDGRIDLDHLDDLLATDPAKLVAICHASNVTGNVQPVRQVAEIAQRRGALSLVDAAQSAGHLNIDVAQIGCDFLAFSAHKALGPSGVGVLYARRDIQPFLRCVRLGGGMVSRVADDRIDYTQGPARFEAGTPNIEGVIGLGAAIGYLSQIGMTSIEEHHRRLDQYLRDRLRSLEFVQIAFAQAAERLPVISFRPSGHVEVSVIARLLSDRYGIAVSAGYQCNQPLYRISGLPGGIRISLHIYNDESNVDALVIALNELQPLLA